MFSTKSCLFWALVANQSFTSTSFSPANTAIPKSRSTLQGFAHHPVLAATLEDYDCQISVDKSDPETGDANFIANLQDFTDILQDTENYPPGSLPKQVVNAAFEVLFHWRKQESKEGAKLVDQLINRFEQEDSQILNNRHYTLAVEAWANSGHVRAAGRAEKALNRMEELAKENPFVTPTRQVYSVVVDAYSEDANASKAFEILKRMEQTSNLEPTSGDYGAVLVPFSRSGDPRRAE